MRKAVLAVLAVLGCLLLAAGCSSAAPAAPRAVATLHISDGIPMQPVTLKPKLARVAAGSTFSVIADTSNGPEAWKLTTVGRPAIVEKRGSAADGSCGSGIAGCTVPQRYMFLAKAAGTTTMVWTEYALGCGGQAGHRCVGVIQPIRVTVTKRSG